MATVLRSQSDRAETAWRDFAPGSWQQRVNVREFIQRNYTPYEGDGAFLAGPTGRNGHRERHSECEDRDHDLSFQASWPST